MGRVQGRQRRRRLHAGPRGHVHMGSCDPVRAASARARLRALLGSPAGSACRGRAWNPPFDWTSPCAMSPSSAPTTRATAGASGAANGGGVPGDCDGRGAQRVPTARLTRPRRPARLARPRHLRACPAGKRAVPCARRPPSCPMNSETPAALASPESASRLRARPGRSSSRRRRLEPEGLFIVSAAPLAIGKRLSLEIYVVGEPAAWPALGRVVWTREIERGRRSSGRHGREDHRYRRRRRGRHGSPAGDAGTNRARSRATRRSPPEAPAARCAKDHPRGGCGVSHRSGRPIVGAAPARAATEPGPAARPLPTMRPRRPPAPVVARPLRAARRPSSESAWPGGPPRAEPAHRPGRQETGSSVRRPVALFFFFFSTAAPASSEPARRRSGPRRAPRPQGSGARCLAARAAGGMRARCVRDARPPPSALAPRLPTEISPAAPKPSEVPQTPPSPTPASTSRPSKAPVPHRRKRDATPAAARPRPTRHGEFVAVTRALRGGSAKHPTTYNLQRRLHTTQSEDINPYWLWWSFQPCFRGSLWTLPGPTLPGGARWLAGVELARPAPPEPRRGPAAEARGRPRARPRRRLRRFRAG